MFLSLQNIIVVNDYGQCIDNSNFKKSMLKEYEPGKRSVWETEATEMDSGKRKYLKKE